ncbi:choice-of-anchor M domain-containing protein [Solirubrobacter phytolaccae]|uniref:Choice-of-anchor M domain-containing protein n=1 Tax=Solirubrobacter phytolaccae TaxID=1404360 RepID=A0A9X3SBB2_9ACTN|nr:choice-of-anchor M domain-containing protein [Solirubrobacter phytolaccae]MDA0185374.1 choice-of-anchor M domain-containing protein [Solirubrobacter phytolaccae]
MLFHAQEALRPAWSTIAIPAGTFVDDRLDWTLNRVDGPGPVQLLEDGRPFFDSADGLPDTVRRPVGTRTPVQWVFGTPGVYTLNFDVEGTRSDGTSSTAYKEYRVFVGALADLPPEFLWVDGLAEAYDPGATATLHAKQSPTSRFTDVRWLERCGETSREVATGATYTFTVTRAHDACELVVTLRDDAGRELLRSDPALLSVRSGSWGPRTILSQGHADVLEVALEGGALKVAVKDDSGDTPVLRRPQDVLLHAKPQAEFVLTEELPPEFGFLGKAGDVVYLLPEVQDPALLWPGWDTAGVPTGVVAGDELSWRLTAVDGPGVLQLFGSDLFGLPRVLFNSADGLPDTTAMPVSTHVHANWASSRPGLYKLRFELSGGATITSGPLDYWFYVGDLADLPAYPSEEPGHRQPWHAPGRACKDPHGPRDNPNPPRGT